MTSPSSKPKKTAQAPGKEHRDRSRWSSVDIPTELWERISTDAKKRFLAPSQLVRQILAQHYGMFGDPPSQGTGS